jgi:DNA-binding CsgD family transcriptional regulator
MDVSMRLSTATVRSHLKHILAKTETSGQSELLLLLSCQASH